MSKLQSELSGVKAAAKALGSKASREVTQVKKRVMSAAARAKIFKGDEGALGKIPSGEEQEEVIQPLHGVDRE